MQIKIFHAYSRQEQVQKLSYTCNYTNMGGMITGATIFWLSLERLRELCMDRTFRLL